MVKTFKYLVNAKRQGRKKKILDKLKANSNIVKLNAIKSIIKVKCKCIKSLIERYRMLDLS